MRMLIRHTRGSGPLPTPALPHLHDDGGRGTAEGAERRDYHFDLSAVRQLLHGVRVFRVVLQQDRHLERGRLRGPHVKGREKQNLNTGENSKNPLPKFEELIYIRRTLEQMQKLKIDLKRNARCTIPLQCNIFLKDVISYFFKH